MPKKYFIITFGCQMNKSDSERIATVLENKGYQSASKENEADLILVNMCSVRQPAVDRVFGLAPKFKKLKTNPPADGPKLKTVLTGCVLKKDKRNFRKIFDSIWSQKNYFNIPPKCQNKSLAYIPISNGCSNFCSYCVVPFTRGPLVCRPHQKILEEVKNAVKKGFKEIWLLGQNVNDYSSRIMNEKQMVNFAKLLEMVNDIPGDFSIRFISPHPADFTDQLVDTIAKCKKVAHYLHLPVQSGDNEILKKMNRSYTVEQYKNLIKKIRKKIPDINLSTDIIVGFPGETQSQFKNTVKLMKEVKFNLAYISKYSSRPGTTAYQLKDNVLLKVKKQREKILRAIINKKMSIPNKKLIVILGPTASGKSELAVNLAKRFDGEIISADSRQVYRGMDIGTGKITKKEMKSIPHYLLDVASPKRKFTVTQYRKLTTIAIDKIFKKKKIPIICGGTGFYIQAVVDGIVIPEVPPDWKLRKKLEKKSAKELYQMLKKIDLRRAKTIEKKNPRRLIRAIEIAKKIGRVPALKKEPLPYFMLLIGIKKEKRELSFLIRRRLLKRLRKGMVVEIKKLKKSGLSWKRLEEFGLEYRYIAQYLQGKISYAVMIESIQKESEHFAKRQMTWWKSDKRIKWVKKQPVAEKLVKKFLENY